MLTSSLAAALLMVACVPMDGGILFLLSAVLKQRGLDGAGKDLKRGGGAARGRCLHQHQLPLADMGETGGLQQGAFAWRSVGARRTG